MRVHPGNELQCFMKEIIVSSDNITVNKSCLPERGRPQLVTMYFDTVPQYKNFTSQFADFINELFYTSDGYYFHRRNFINFDIPNYDSDRFSFENIRSLDQTKNRSYSHIRFTIRNWSFTANMSLDNDIQNTTFESLTIVIECGVQGYKLYQYDHHLNSIIPKSIKCEPLPTIPSISTSTSTISSITTILITTDSTKAKLLSKTTKTTQTTTSKIVLELSSTPYMTSTKMTKTTVQKKISTATRTTTSERVLEPSITSYMTSTEMAQTTVQMKTSTTTTTTTQTTTNKIVLEPSSTSYMTSTEMAQTTVQMKTSTTTRTTTSERVLEPSSTSYMTSTEMAQTTVQMKTSTTTTTTNKIVLEPSITPHMASTKTTQSTRSNTRTTNRIRYQFSFIISLVAAGILIPCLLLLLCIYILCKRKTRIVHRRESFASFFSTESTVSQESDSFN